MGPVELARPWVSVDSTRPKDIRYEAGVYRNGDRLLAVNRPSSEDDPDVLDSTDARKLFGGLPVQTLEEQGVDVGPLQGEVWRVFVFAMLLMLIGEGILILPARRAPASPGRGKAAPRRREEQAA